MRPEEPGEDERGQRQPDEEPRPEVEPPRRREEQRGDEHVRRCERREEGRDEPPQRLLVARVVDEVLRQAGQPPVGEAELLREPAARARVPPPGERDRVDVDEPECGDRAGRAEDRGAEAARVSDAEVEPAPEEVRRDGKEVVADAEHDAAVGGARRRGRAAGSAPRGRRGRRRRSRASRRAAGGTGGQPRSRQTSSSPSASSASFHAETTSSAPPRMPACQSSAIARLWSASPTTKTWRIQTGRRRAHAGPTATSVIPRLTILTGYGKSAASSPGPSGSSTSSKPRARSSRRAQLAVGQPVHDGQQRVRVDREQRFGVVTKTRLATRQSSPRNRRCPCRPPATCSIDGVREAEVERAVGERQLAPVGAHGRHPRERGGEAVELGVADGGDALGPRVERLEEVVGRAVAERRIGDADVDAPSSRAPAEEVEEQAQLPLPAPQGDASRRHAAPQRESNGAGGTAIAPARAGSAYGPQGAPPSQIARPVDASATSASWTRIEMNTTSTSSPSRSPSRTPAGVKETRDFFCCQSCHQTACPG